MLILKKKTKYEKHFEIIISHYKIIIKKLFKL